MKCKDIQVRPILEYLSERQKTFCFNFLPEDIPNDTHDHLIVNAMPKGTPRKLVIAKMAALIRKGLVDGCPCGCRGDYEISEEGLEYLKKEGI